MPAAQPPRHSHRRLLAVGALSSGITLLLTMLGLLLFVDQSGGSAPGPDGHQVTLCHATGSQTHPFEEITVDVQAGGLQGGHDNDNHQNGRDIIPPFTYVDKDDAIHSFPGRNLGTQYGTANGQQVLDAHCAIPDSTPQDACPNLAGVQATVPDGYVVDAQGQCVPRPVEDVCPNIEGAQSTVPDGYRLTDGRCEPTPTDVCPNVDGSQSSVPDGLVLDGSGSCVRPPTKATDVCPNIGGTQTTLPDGSSQDDSGNCVTTAGESATPTGEGGGGSPPAVDGTTPTPSNAAGASAKPHETVVSGELPYTGAEAWVLGVIGAALLLVGAVLELGGRRESGKGHA